MQSLRNSLAYYKTILIRACRETFELFDVRKFQTWLRIGITMLGFFVLWLASGADPAMSEIKTWVITIVVPTVGLFVLVLLVQLIYAPVRVHLEQFATNEGLQRNTKGLSERLQPRLSIEFRPESPFEQNIDSIVMKMASGFWFSSDFTVSGYDARVQRLA